VIRPAALAFVLAVLTGSAAIAQAPPPPASGAGQAPDAQLDRQPPASATPGATETPAPVPRRRRTQSRPRREATPPAPTTDLPAFVTEEAIAVTSDYRGSSVGVFGVKPDRLGRGDIVVALRGPNQATVVRRKTRFLMLWVNSDPVRFEEAPSFLAVISARPLREIASPRAIWTLRLDPAASARLAGPTPPGADPSGYRRALVRLRRQAGLYVENPRGLRVRDRALFDTQIKLPANAPIGKYVSDIYFFRNGRLISTRTGTVEVSRQGLERTIYDIATRLSFLYGLGVMAFALGAGWLAAVWFKRS
jgi:uncharacterized protein (TIGR02186 family)